MACGVIFLSTFLEVVVVFFLAVEADVTSIFFNFKAYGKQSMKNYPRIACFGVFRFAKKIKLLIEGDIRCIFRVFPGTFVVCRGPHWSN